VELAQLVRYEHVQATLDSPPFAAAVAELEENDKRLQDVGFSLQDLHGQKWDLKDRKVKWCS
jgi:hypothetical protein